MSCKASAKLVDLSEDDIMEIELEEDYIQEVNALLVGSPTKGELFLTTHRCPFCHCEMQTIGIAHSTYECSKCAATRSRNIKMERSFRSLEADE